MSQVNKVRGFLRVLVRDKVVAKAFSQFVPSSNTKTRIRNHAADRYNRLSDCSTD